jgi:pimeloyl-ACP methyl ester carboxylesterase
VQAIPRLSADRLRRLAMPVLLLVGGRDILLDSQESARLLERLVPTASVRVLPGAGHILLGQSVTVLDFLIC